MNLDPTPVAPPGMENLLTIVNWVSWGVAVICLVTFLGGIAYLAVGAMTGRESHGVKTLAISLIACVLLGAAASIIAVLV